MLKVLILLGHLVAQLVINLAFLLIHYVWVALVQEHSCLPGWEEWHGCLSAFFTGCDYWFTAFKLVTKFELGADWAHSFQHFDLLCLSPKFLLQHRGGLAHLHDFQVQMCNNLLQSLEFGTWQLAHLAELCRFLWGHPIQMRLLILSSLSLGHMMDLG